MADGRFVVNASPLILLAAVDALFLLPRLAGEIWVPSAVVGEVCAGRDPHPALLGLASAPWLQINPLLAVPSDIAGWDLGAGESQVLALALAHADSEAILDDQQARRCARSLGVQVTGTLGIILRAKQRALIPSARPLIERLLEERLYLSHELVERALAEIGE